MIEKGYLTIVLHAHLPYVKHPEYEDSLEENWLYEALTDSYIPLLLVLEGLIEDGVDFRLTFSLTSTLISMLLDPFLQSRYLERLERMIELAEKELKRTRSEPKFHSLARMYNHRLHQVREAFLNRYNRNLIKALKQFQELGKIEIMSSAATHGYLPVLSVNSSAVKSQIQVGIDHHQQVFGQMPKGFWLPECGYYPGVDGLLREHGIRYTILETHGITRASPRPRYGVYAPVYCPTGVAAFGRDPDSSKQVWSSISGYPGDYDYREFYRDIAYDLDFEYIKPYIHCDGIRTDTGIKYFRITGKGDYKEIYVPRQAEKKAELHAENFIFNLEKQAGQLSSIMDRKPLIIAPYDAELFGHWWFEGPIWLDKLIRKVSSEQRTIRLVTISEYLEEYPINQISTPSLSSWGYEGFSEVWLNEKNDWILSDLRQATITLEDLAKRHPRAEGLTLRALNQAMRELLLAQGSDWPFMITNGTTADYAAKRIKTHLQGLHRLCSDIENSMIDEAWLSMLENSNNIFPRLSYHSLL